MSDVIKRDVFNLIEKELEAANKKFPLFNSNHEAFAVLLEEVEEAHEEMIALEILKGNIWKMTKEGAEPEALHEQFTAAYNTAINLAVEAIQCAAMARKGILSNIDLCAIDRAERGGDL